MKTADSLRVEGRRRGSQRWDDCVKRDLEGVDRENESL